MSKYNKCKKYNPYLMEGSSIDMYLEENMMSNSLSLCARWNKKSNSLAVRPLKLKKNPVFPSEEWGTFSGESQGLSTVPVIKNPSSQSCIGQIWSWAPHCCIIIFQSSLCSFKWVLCLLESGYQSKKPSFWWISTSLTHKLTKIKLGWSEDTWVLSTLVIGGEKNVKASHFVLVYLLFVESVFKFELFYLCCVMTNFMLKLDRLQNIWIAGKILFLDPF